MKNRKIRHLFDFSPTGRFYVPTDLQTLINISLLNANKDAIQVFSRLGGMIANRKQKNRLESLKNLFYSVGMEVGIVSGNFEGYNGVVSDITEGADGKYYFSVELDNAIGCKHVIGLSETELIKL